jgi:predicted glycosyltransferase
VRAWIDIDNPPQARYLLPVARRFEQAGHDVLLSARAHGDTFAILRSEGAAFEAIGSSFGKGLPRKLYGLGRRARMLIDFIGRQTTPVDLVLTGSRSATLAARRLAIPSFVIIDYEYVNLLFYELSGSHIMYPNVIGATAFRRRGVSSKHLMPFEGLKEDISFADIDLGSIPSHEFGDSDASAVRILFRPPAEDSHYYRRESRELALELLRYLAAAGASVVLSPRERGQEGYLDEVPRWEHEPIVLREPVPFVSLLKGVDAVVSAGGTMLREAAYLGVPAYSIFRSRLGAVDRYLASTGRLSLLTSVSDFSRIRLTQSRSISPLRDDSGAAEAAMLMILDRAEAAKGGRPKMPFAT